MAATAVLSALAGAAFSRPATGSAPAPRADRFSLALAAVLLLLWMNQVAFNAWVHAVHHGRTDFLGREFPAAFFARLAPHHAAVVALEAAIPDARWLAPSAFRVQAVLELPFAVLAYLGVARLVDRGVARQIAAGPIGVMMCVSHTVVLCVIEELLRNRYTDQDLVLRGVGLVLTVPLLRALAGPALAPEAPSVWRLFWFVMGLAAMSVLTVGTNLVALLYNLGWLDTLGLPLLAAAGVMAAASWASGAAVATSRSWLVALLFAFGRRFTLLFAAPALAIRYAGGRPGAQSAAALALAFVVLLAAGLAAREAWREVPRDRRGAWVFRALTALVGAALLPTLRVLDLTGAPGLDLPDVWMLARAGEALGGFLLGWGAAAASRPTASPS